MDQVPNTPPVVTPTSAPGSKKTLYIVIAIVVLLIIGWISTRGMNWQERSVMKKAGVDVDYNLKGGATYTNENGATATIGVNKYPDNWPSDAPRYSAGTIQYSGTSNPQTGKEGSAVVYMTSDSAATVANFYQKELTSNGWTIAQTATIGQATVIAATKGTKSMGIYIAENGQGQTSVTVGIENP